MNLEDAQVNPGPIEEPFGFTLDKINADAVEAVENPIVRAAI